MQGLGTNGTAVVAAFLTCLKEPDDDGVASAAAGSLGKLALEPNLVIPAFATKMSNRPYVSTADFTNA